MPLEALPDLPAYLAKRGRRVSPAHEQPGAALQAFLGAVWADVTDFVFDEQRFETAYRELEEATYAGHALL